MTKAPQKPASATAKPLNKSAAAAAGKLMQAALAPKPTSKKK